MRSLQSLHDVGNADSIEMIDRRCHCLLGSGGILINADLVVEAGKDEAPDSGKLTVEHHLMLWGRAGYKDARCALRIGPFGCVEGVRRR